MKEGDGLRKNFFFYAAISLLLIIFVVGYFISASKNSFVGLSSDPLVDEQLPGCIGWQTQCSTSVAAQSAIFSGPDAEDNAKTDALAKCEVSKQNIDSSIQNCIDSYAPFCESPCQLSSKETEKNLNEACRIGYCINVLDNGNDNPYTICTYTYNIDGTLRAGSCSQWHPRGRSGFTPGWYCYATDGNVKHDVICA